MALPPRAYYSVIDLTYRWECSLADLVGWASVERFDIMTVLPPMRCGSKRIGGFVILSVADVFPMFRRHVGAPSEVCLQRVKEVAREDWVDLDEMPHGKAVTVRLEDLLVMADQVREFEAEHDLLRRPASHIGASARYDWENMYVTQILRVYEKGLPASQSAWVGEVQDWFAECSDNGNVPDERTIRRRLTPIWKALRPEG